MMLFDTLKFFHFIFDKFNLEDEPEHRQDGEQTWEFKFCWGCHLLISSYRYLQSSSYLWYNF